jgi:hypothetical protein
MREGPISFATNLTADDIEASVAARNALILIRRTIETAGLPVTTTGNLSRAVAANICKLIDWPDYDQADAFRFSKVINEPTSCRSISSGLFVRRRLCAVDNLVPPAAFTPSSQSLRSSILSVWLTRPNGRLLSDF